MVCDKQYLEAAMNYTPTLRSKKLISLKHMCALNFKTRVNSLNYRSLTNPCIIAHSFLHAILRTFLLYCSLMHVQDIHLSASCFVVLVVCIFVCVILYVGQLLYCMQVHCYTVCRSIVILHIGQLLSLKYRSIVILNVGQLLNYMQVIVILYVCLLLYGKLFSRANLMCVT